MSCEGRNRDGTGAFTKDNPLDADVEVLDVIVDADAVEEEEKDELVGLGIWIGLRVAAVDDIDWTDWLHGGSAGIFWALGGKEIEDL
ncbi:UNVERIFIED_CONTAM: hypothetical protein HDU68_003990, partial [Siphonaria sp. JEL0065]